MTARSLFLSLATSLALVLTAGPARPEDQTPPPASGPSDRAAPAPQETNPETTPAQGHLEKPGDRRASRVGPTMVSPPVHPGLAPFTIEQVNVDLLGNNIVGDAANEPSIAVDPNDPNRIVIVWRQFDTISSNFRQAGWAFSHDGGRIWEFPGRVEPGVFRSDPVLAVDTQGMFYYCSLRGDFSVDLFPSDTSGITWLPGADAYGGDKQWIAIDRTGGLGEGNVYIAWSIAAGCCGDRIFTRSVDGGHSFMNPILVPTSPVWGTFAIGKNGELYLSGVQGDPFDTSNFIVAKSMSARDPSASPSFETFSVANLDGYLEFGGGPNPGGLLGQVWVDVDRSDGPYRGNVYLLASVNPPGHDPLDVHFVRSSDGGNTWSTPVRVNDDPGTDAWQWFGTMSVAPNGRIDVVWNDTRNDSSGRRSQLFYSYSIDAGVSWSPNVAVSGPWDSLVGWPDQDKIGDYYHMLSDEVGADLAFAATFNGEQDVYHTRLGEYDCNGNGVPDSSDISNGFSPDRDGNGIPDECDELLLIGPTPGPAGRTNTLYLTKGTPGEIAYFFLGTIPGAIPIGPCPGTDLGILDPMIVGAFPSDTRGRVTLNAFVDASFAGATFLFQALELSTCHASGVVTHTF